MPTDHDQAGRHRPSGSRRVLRPLAVYAAVVGVIAGAGTAMIATTPEYDASIGGAGLFLVVMLLGIPWSLGTFLADNGITGSLLSTVLYVASAVVNGAVVLLMRERWKGRLIARKQAT